MKYSKEDKVAEKMIGLTNDISLDLDSVGRYIAESSSSTQYNRIYHIFEVAKERKEYMYSDQYQKGMSS